MKQAQKSAKIGQAGRIARGTALFARSFQQEVAKRAVPLAILRPKFKIFKEGYEKWTKAPSPCPFFKMKCMIFFDSHMHLMDEQYDGIRDEIVENARKNNVLYMANIGYNRETSVKAVEDAKKYDGVYAVVGIHPENIDDLDDEFKFIYELANEPKVVAIGEIGLDYHYGGDAERQKEILVRQIEIANELKKPVVIHSRDADMDMLKVLKENKIENGFVMHCFSSSVEVLKEVLKLGAYVSLGGPVTFKNARSLIEVAKLIPEDRLLIETDAPYLAPEPFRGKRNEAAYVVHTAQKIADLRECLLEKIAEITTENTKKFYGIK